MSDLRKEAIVRAGIQAIDQFDGPADEAETSEQTTPQSANPSSTPIPSTSDRVSTLPATAVAGGRVSTPENGPPFGIHPFPSPHPSAGYKTPPPPHHGPADSPSFESPKTAMYRARIDPNSPYYHEATYRFHLGNRHQPEARDPMSEPTDREEGTPGATPEQAEVRRLGAIHHMAMSFLRLQTGGHMELATKYDDMYEQDHGEDYRNAKRGAMFQQLHEGQTNLDAATHHAAMVYRYLSAGDHRDWGNRYHQLFTDDLGELYGDYVFDVIQNEPHGADEGEQDDGDYYYD